METGVAIPKNIQSLIYDSLTNTSNEEHSLKTLSSNSEVDASELLVKILNKCFLGTTYTVML